MANAYYELKKEHQKEFNAFPMMFAFSDKQFEEGMAKLGLEPTDTDKIYKFGGGGYYRKTDAEELREMLERHHDEMMEARKDDDFLYDMFYYELANHEYGYTYDLEPTLDALDLTIEEIEADERLSKALKKAKKDIQEEEKYY